MIPSFVLGRLNASTYQTRTPRRSNSLRPCWMIVLTILLMHDATASAQLDRLRRSKALEQPVTAETPMVEIPEGLARQKGIANGEQVKVISKRGQIQGLAMVTKRLYPLKVDGKELWLSISGVQLEGGVVYAFRNVTQERALEELKGDFVATISHELRTPLAAIYGAAQTLRRTDLRIDANTTQRLLEIITVECERLTRIAGDVLLVGASEGPDSRRAAVYRRPLTGDGPFERCEKGLPEWFEGNVDTHRLAAAGDTIAFATEDDRVFLSEDAGASWDELARVPGLQCLAFA